MEICDAAEVVPFAMNHVVTLQADAVAGTCYVGASGRVAGVREVVRSISIGLSSALTGSGFGENWSKNIRPQVQQPQSAT